MTSVRDISRQGQTVPTEHPILKDHLRILAREINGLIAHKAIFPVDTPATISSTYTMVDSDSLILCKADNPITVFLLTAAGREGKEVTIKKIDAGATPVIIDAKDSETIDGATTVTLTAQYSFITPKSDNTNWWAVAQRADVGSGGYTDEQAQDAVGGILADSATIDFTYTDATPEITAIVKDASITEAKQVLADNTTQDVSTTKHGYVPKAPNDTTKFLRGDATWAVPPGAAFSGARVTKAANQTTADYSAGAIITFDGEVYDQGGWHDNSTNNSRLTVPTGIVWVNFTWNVHNTLGTAGQFRGTRLYKNGSLHLEVPTNIGGNAEMGINGTSGWLATVATDYWELWYFSGGDASITVIAANTFFAVEGRAS